jgi:glyoxylase-like metal-dependent hydrolase (beta-lactamase superfamily II)
MHVEKFVGGPYSANSYAVHDNGEAIVIDVPLHTAKKIIEFVKNSNLSVALVVATHVHWDHIADAYKLCKATGAKFAIHGADENNQIEINSVFVDEAGIIKADRHVEDHEEIEVGSIVLDVLHTPGHTPGSICLHLKKEKILFSGDTIFAGSYGRVDFPLGDGESMRKSLRRLSILPFDTFVYPGHGPHTTIGSEKWLASI